MSGFSMGKEKPVAKLVRAATIYTCIFYTGAMI
jgi:hypothetical protein